MHFYVYWLCGIPVWCCQKRNGNMVWSRPRNCRYAIPSHLQPWGPIFEKSYKPTKKLMKSLTYEKLRMSIWLSKNLAKNLGRNYAKLMKNLTTTLQVSYKNVKFAPSDVIRETLCHRLLLVKYFELKITDNQSDDFLRMLTYENLTTNLGKILQSFKNRSPGSLYMVVYWQPWKPCETTTGCGLTWKTCRIKRLHVL